MENTEIIQKARAKAEMWLNDAYDKATRTEVERLLNASDPTELIDSFYNDLEFGTGGLRGIMGVGSNRMNIYTVGAATQGFANYINRLFPGENNSVCIGHDCRLSFAGICRNDCSDFFSQRHYSLSFRIAASDTGNVVCYP